MSNEKIELLNAISDNATVIKLKKLENYLESDKNLKNVLSEIMIRQKKAVSKNDQYEITSLLNDIQCLKTNINLAEYLNVQEDINDLFINIQNIIESTLKG